MKVLEIVLKYIAIFGCVGMIFCFATGRQTEIFFYAIICLVFALADVVVVRYNKKRLLVS